MLQPRGEEFGRGKMLRLREASVTVRESLRAWTKLWKKQRGSGFGETENKVGSQARTQWLETGEECGFLAVGGGLCPVTRI